jgi:hypothetical protein
LAPDRVDRRRNVRGRMVKLEFVKLLKKRRELVVHGL